MLQQLSTKTDVFITFDLSLTIDSDSLILITQESTEFQPSAVNNSYLLNSMFFKLCGHTNKQIISFSMTLLHKKENIHVHTNSEISIF